MLSLREDFSGSCLDTSSFQKRSILSRGNLEGLQGNLAPSTYFPVLPFEISLGGVFAIGTYIFLINPVQPPNPVRNMAVGFQRAFPNQHHQCHLRTCLKCKFQARRAVLDTGILTSPPGDSGHVMCPGPLGIPRWLSGKESACQCSSSVPRLGSFPGVGNGNSLQYSCIFAWKIPWTKEPGRL